MSHEFPDSIRFPDPLEGSVDLLVIAGEHSGDEHAAVAVRDLQAAHPELKICVIGGPALARVGQPLFDLTAVSVIGFFEVLKHFGFFRAFFHETLRWIREHRPRHVCFVDYPGMNLRLAKALKDAGLSRQGGGSITLHYYVAPQVWAWKAGRRFKMAETLDRLGVLFPFEVECFADTRLETEFVGHPFVRSDYRVPLQFDASAPVLLLPGSRVAAVGRIFPVLLEAFERARSQSPALTARVVYPGETVLAELNTILARYPGLAGAIELIPNNHGEAIQGSAVLMSSGTFSLVGALAGLPGAIVYRLHPVSYWMGRLLVKIPYIGIANILAGRAIYREYIQHMARAEVLADELVDARTEARVAEASASAALLRDLLRPEHARTAATWLWDGMNR